MNNAIKNTLIFVTGAAIGAVVTWKVVKAKYEQIAQEEIDSVKEAFSTKTDETDTPEETSDDDESDAGDTEYHELANTYRSASDSKKEETKMAVKPYVINPDDVGTLDGYDVQTLTYYANGVLTDDWDIVIDDVEGTVGSDAFNHFGEYNEDTVCVRNDNLKTDYEICLDDSNYPGSNNDEEDDWDS